MQPGAWRLCFASNCKTALASRLLSGRRRRKHEMPARLAGFAFTRCRRCSPLASIPRRPHPPALHADRHFVAHQRAALLIGIVSRASPICHAIGLRRAADDAHWRASASAPSPRQRMPSASRGSWARFTSASAAMAMVFTRVSTMLRGIPSNNAECVLA